MIDEVHVQSYRSLRDVRLRLGPLTVLVGPNGSGKSSLLQAMGLSVDVRDTWRRTSRESLDIRWRMDGETRSIQQGGRVDGHLLRLELPALRQSNELGAVVRLNTSGDNLVNVIFSFGRERGAEYARRLRALVPQFSDLDVQPGPEAGRASLRFVDRWAPQVTYRPDQVSDGTMLVAGFLAAAMMPGPTRLLLVEEPERGLHPWLVGQVVELFRVLSAPTDGSDPVQVVCATHSADLLRHLKPDEVRFVDRDPETGETRVREAPTQHPSWSEAIAEYESIADLWLTGALGGVPSR